MKAKTNNFLVSLAIVMICVGLACFIGFEIYLWIKYGSKPINEIPTWVLWLMFGKR